MEPEWFNVASAAMVPGRIETLWVRFANAGYPDDQLPVDSGWMPSAPFSGHVVGKVEMRDTLSKMVETRVGREVPYTRAHKSNLMREGRVFESCTWPVMSIPMIDRPLLETIADGLVRTKARRCRSSM